MLFLVTDDSAVSKKPFIHLALTNWDRVIWQRFRLLFVCGECLSIFVLNAQL